MTQLGELGVPVQSMVWAENFMVFLPGLHHPGGLSCLSSCLSLLNTALAKAGTQTDCGGRSRRFLRSYLMVLKTSLKNTKFLVVLAGQSFRGNAQ